MPVAITLRAGIDQYMQVKGKHWALGTQRSVVGALDQFHKLVGDIQLRHLKATHVNKAFEAWEAHTGKIVMDRPNGAATINRKLSHLRQFLVWSHRRGYLSCDVGTLLEDQPNRHIDNRPRLYLTAEQILNLFERCRHPRDRAFLALAAYTGLRVSEIVALRVGHVDLEQGYLYVTMFKNRKHDRLPITSDLDAELRRWLSEYARLLEAQGQGALTPDMCLVPAKDRPCQPGGTNYSSLNDRLKPHRAVDRQIPILRKLLVEAGFPVEYEGLHTVRRSVARLLYEFLKDTEVRDDAVAVVQAMLNHSTPEMTLKYIGVDYFREKRDATLKGKSFLTAMVDHTGTNVIPLHRNTQ